MADTGCETCDAIAAGKLNSVSESDFRARVLEVLCSVVAGLGGGGAAALLEVAGDSGDMLGSLLTGTYQVLYDNGDDPGDPLDILNAVISNNTNLPIVVSLDGATQYAILFAGDSLTIDFAANGLKLTESIYIKYFGDATADAAVIAAETEYIMASVLYPA